MNSTITSAVLLVVGLSLLIISFKTTHCWFMETISKARAVLNLLNAADYSKPNRYSEKLRCHMKAVKEAYEALTEEERHEYQALRMAEVRTRPMEAEMGGGADGIVDYLR
jgi:hypothetical protein